MPYEYPWKQTIVFADNLIHITRSILEKTTWNKCTAKEYYYRERVNEWLRLP